MTKYIRKICKHCGSKLIFISGYPKGHVICPECGKKPKEKEVFYSYSDIAKKIGVTEQAISKWMTGKSFPSYKNLLKLEKATGMSLGQITKMLQKNG